VATVFGLFSMFWLSFALLVLGTTHGWFVSWAVEPEAAVTAGVWATIAGYVAFAAAANGVYVFFDAMGQATGGKAMSLGHPIQK